MKIKMVSFLLSLIMIASNLNSYFQIVVQSSSISNETSGLADSPWPMFRCNLNHTGLSPYDTSANPGKLKWSFDTGGDVQSAPAIGFDGAIYVGSYDNKLYAINPDGTEKWNYTTNYRVRSSPAIGFDGTIYVGSYDNKLYAINPDGTEKWNFTTGWYISWSSAAIGYDGTIYIGSEDHKLYAINPDGSERWNFTTNKAIHSSPAISSDGTIYVGSWDKNLYSIKPDGTLKWSFLIGHYVWSSPSIGSDGTIYVGSSDNKLYAINPDGTHKWSFVTGSDVDSSPAIGFDGTIYVGSDDDLLYAINPDGTQKWNFTTGGQVQSSPAIGSDGTIYVGSRDHKLYAINPDGTEKWNFITGNLIHSSPAIGSDGTIYVGSADGNLYAIGTPTQPQRPIADAGPDQTVNEGDVVQFNGSGSTAGGGVVPDAVAVWHMDEGSGDTIYDETDYHNDGEIYKATWTTGKYGSALSFDGLHDFVDVPTSPSLNITDMMTMHAWIKPKRTDYGYVVCKELNPGHEGRGGLYSLDIYPGQVRSILHEDSPVYYWHQATGTTDIVYDVWQHIAMTWDGNVLKVFYNGQVEDSVNFTGKIKTSAANVGIGRYGPVFFKGIIDEVAIYDCALSDQDILRIYQTGSLNYSQPGELTYEWDFDSDVDSDGDGNYTNDVEATGPTPTHIYGDDGIYTVTLTVSTPYETGDVIKVAQDCVLVMDSSGSMSWNDPLNLRIDAAKQYVDKMTPDDRGCVVDFDTDADLMPPGPYDDHLSMDYAKIKGNLDYIDSMGGTGISRGLNLSNEELRNNADPSHVPIMILLTDAANNDPIDNNYCLIEANIAASRDIKIFTIGLAMLPNSTEELLLKEIADITDGKYFPAPDAGYLEMIYDNISKIVGNYSAGRLFDTDTMEVTVRNVNPTMEPITAQGATALQKGVMEEWVARYNGPHNYNDFIYSMAVDPSGNVYVTGDSHCKGETGDSYTNYTTIKYDINGNELWMASYNGPGNLWDGAWDIAVDSSGNVYVTGMSWGSGTLWDYATIKYDPDGNELWVARYDGGGDDLAHAITLDCKGYVYVTGGSEYDFVTIKYDSYGNLIWVARNDGTNGEAWDIEIDDLSGNVYVTGWSAKIGIGVDYATIAYDSLGNELWVTKYDGPGKGYDYSYNLALDSAGDIYITGWSRGIGTSDDYTTIKYDSLGNELWVARYNGPDNGSDNAADLAVDSLGNVYVTGGSKGSGYQDYTTIKYDSNGNQIWVARSIEGVANGIAIDNSSGNIYVTGRSCGDFATVAYDRNGNELWITRYNGPSGGDAGLHIAVDSSGNVYASGNSKGNGTHSDFCVIKYSTSSYYECNEGSSIKFTGTASDPGSDDLTFTWNWGDGTSDTVTKYYNNGLSSEPDYNPATNKIKSPWGTYPFTTTDTVSHIYGDNGVYSITLTVSDDDNGMSTYTTTITVSNTAPSINSITAPSGFEGSPIAFSSTVTDQGSDDLTFTWEWGDGTSTTTTTYYNNGASPDPHQSPLGTYPFTVTDTVQHTYGDNGVYTITLTVEDDDGGSTSYETTVNVNNVVPTIDTIIVQNTTLMSQDVTEEWVARYNPPGNGYDWGMGLAVDSTGNVYVTGYSDNSATVRDYLTIAYDILGNELWRARYDGPANDWDFGTSIVVDSLGNVYVTGGSRGSGTYSDFATLKYDSSGNLLWEARYNGPANGYDAAHLMVIDSTGNIYVVGESQGSGTSRDFATVAYDSSGNQLWTARYDGPGHDWDEPRRISLDNNGNIYVT
ncbi:MAG: PQQ-binding-like beta-propeller repeat protein, partial [Thermoplasmata archaeon]